jgi:hypothetical protein
MSQDLEGWLHVIRMHLWSLLVNLSLLLEPLGFLSLSATPFPCFLLNALAVLSTFG